MRSICLLLCLTLLTSCGETQPDEEKLDLPVLVRTLPQGAVVEIRAVRPQAMDSLGEPQTWTYIGRTPIGKVGEPGVAKIPAWFAKEKRAALQIRVSKQGYSGEQKEWPQPEVNLQRGVAWSAKLEPVIGR